MAALLAQSGDNLVLVNPELFVEQELLRIKIRADELAARHRFENSSTPVKFHLFPRFALELRRMIWKHAAENEPRLVEITYDSHEATIESMFPSRTLVPAILHTSQEARACGLEVYEKLDCGSLFTGINSTYINWEIDVVSFDGGYALAEFMRIHQDMSEQSIIAKKCRNLAVLSKDFGSLKDIVAELRPEEKLFHNLDNFIVIAPSGEIGTWEDGNLALAQLAEGTDTTAVKMEIHSLQKTYPEKDGTGWGTTDKKICIMDVVRERHRLMTAAEKQARKRAQENKDNMADVQAAQANTLMYPETEAELEQEARQKQFEEDLLMAAQLQALNL